jgi:pimeloyl-ACP methyl ester carboxylesterase
MTLPKGKFITIDGVKTHYYEKGRGRPLVLVHGGNFGSTASSGGAVSWSLNIDGLARHHRVIAVDKLGQGYTGNPKRDADYTMAAVVRHLGGFLEKMKLADVNLVGHSRGGYVVGRLTLEQPDLVRTCTIVDSNSLAPGIGLNEVVLANPPGPRLGRACQRWVLERYSYSPHHIDDEWLDTVVDIGRQPKHKVAVRKMEGQRLNARQFLPSLHQGKSECFGWIRDRGMRRPTMVVWGYNDPTATLDQGRALFDLIAGTEPRSYMHVINRAGHFSYRENPDHFNNLIEGFVQSA